MKPDSILHYAFRARDPLTMGKFYAQLFDAQYFLHPVMTGLGIVILKITGGGCFVGLLEFWPLDVEWDGRSMVFRKVKPVQPSISYGHLAVKMSQSADEVTKELDRKGIAWHMEARAPGISIPVVIDPEGNMVELFCNFDDMPLPKEALCPPQFVEDAMKAITEQFKIKTRNLPAGAGVPLMME